MSDTGKRRLLFGTAGIPAAAKGKGILVGLETLAGLGLDAMEIEFVRGVKMSEEAARNAGRKARSHRIYLTAHAPYWLNFNSSDPKIVRASGNRVLEAARIASMAGAKSLAFHAAFYCGMEPDEVYNESKNKGFHPYNEESGNLSGICRCQYRGNCRRHG